MLCFYCGEQIKIDGTVGRGDTCPKCRSDQKVCKNCEHYDEKLYNNCRETRAERVVNKTQANFCELFAPNQKGSGANTGASSELSATEKARQQAEALFKKLK